MSVSTNIGRIKNKTMQKNNTSGHTGVSWHSRKGQWLARITFRKKTYNLGYFDDIELAVKAREKAEKMTFDEFLKSLQKAKTITIK